MEDVLIGIVVDRRSEVSFGVFIDVNSRISVWKFGGPVMLMSDRLISTFSHYALRLEYGVACLLIQDLMSWLSFSLCRCL